MQEQAIIQRNGVVQHGTDAGLFVEFYTQPLEDEERSKELGRPFYRDVDFVKIIPIGDTKTVMCRPVRLHPEGGQPSDPDRWPQKYQQFKNQQVQVDDGTPVTEWPPLSKSQALMLKGMNIHTVEQLAAVGDHNLANIGRGARELREKAKAFLDEADRGSGLLKLQSENEDLKKQVEALRNQIEGLSKEFGKKEPIKDYFAEAKPFEYKDELSAITPDFTPSTSSYGKRGRPPKQKETEND